MATNEYTVAAFYFPNFHTDPRMEAIHGKNWTEWELIKTAPSRFPGHKVKNHPLWGYEDEADPLVMAKKIDAAADHGLDVWLFDWYYYDDGPFLERCLTDGFLKASNRNRMKFALMWANHDWYQIHGYDPTQGDCPINFPGSVKPETFEKICDRVIENYFKQPNYWKINGCPVFSIYEINTFALSYPDSDAVLTALEKFRSKVKAAGFPDLHLNIMYWGEPNLPGGRTPKNWPAVLKAIHADSATSYTWVHHGALGAFPETPYQEALKKYIQEYANARETLPVPYFPNVTMGWDNTPRCARNIPWKPMPHVGNPVLVGNTPAAFQHALECIKSEMDTVKGQPRILTINAWNEWPETSILEPEAEYGYGYLEAVRNVFGK